MAFMRLSSIAGVLASIYVVPTWLSSAYSMFRAPMPTLYEAQNLAIVHFFGDYLQLGSLFTVRFGWMLALLRFVTVAFLVVFLVHAILPKLRRSARGMDEALTIGLSLGCMISFACMLLAWQVGLGGSVRYHATELLLMLAAGIILTIEPLWHKVEMIDDRPRKRDLPELGSGTSLNQSLFREH